ncbi:hypothetical protein EVAR_47333_1 [Eumeta japonica]|uniref:Uncharacterized protein n=1 Tax=Eumeta variegata TaxID=151549 RepID=A0A4C1WWM6_EUMVA|nr:hypothetical protein EVAR_47333_1 [Eumeta japonica]
MARRGVVPWRSFGVVALPSLRSRINIYTERFPLCYTAQLLLPLRDTYGAECVLVSKAFSLIHLFSAAPSQVASGVQMHQFRCNLEMAHPPVHMGCIHYNREGVAMHFAYFTYERHMRSHIQVLSPSMDIRNLRGVTVTGALPASWKRIRYLIERDRADEGNEGEPRLYLENRPTTKISSSDGDSNEPNFEILGAPTDEIGCRGKVYKRGSRGLGN